VEVSFQSTGKSTCDFALTMIDYDPWISLTQGPFGILFQIWFELYATLCGGLALSKLVKYIRSFGVQASISQVCLFLEILAAIERMLYVVSFII
jgi:hypothetical protein